MFGTERWENQVDFWPTELTESKEDMYAMIYQELACMGAMAVEQDGGTFSPNMKTSPCGEVLHIMMGDPGRFQASRVDRI